MGRRGRGGRDDGYGTERVGRGGVRRRESGGEEGFGGGLYEYVGVDGMEGRS